MEREILFRGKRIDNGEWVYGNLIQSPDGTFILETDSHVEFREPDYHSHGMGCGLEDRNINDRYEAMAHGFEKAVEKCADLYPCFIPVEKETVGQWTGKKDSDGVGIYEGDRIKSLSTGMYYSVEWDLARGAFMGNSGHLTCMHPTKWDAAKIVGNIHTPQPL